MVEITDVDELPRANIITLKKLDTAGYEYDDGLNIIFEGPTKPGHI